ncbi:MULTISPECIES: APC family permease [unclassified Acinetobacter]|uniref:APC family permease n=1 Tax=unclassified Acinetobacter TaxID=196816 RepID=UPI0035BA5660
MTPLATTATSSPAKLQRTLGLWHIIIIGLAYIQPMTVLDTFGMVSEASVQHVPTSYIIALIAVLLTSLSYGAMIRRYPSSGSAYTYAQKSIHPNVGFMVGWSSWLDYLLSPLVNIILAVIYLEALFPNINAWVWVIGLTAFMTGINILGSKIVAYFNSWIVLVQLIVIGVFTWLIYSKLSVGINADGTINPEGYQLWSLAPFWTEIASMGALITGATILCFSFTGFDSLSSLAEETKDVSKTLPKAIFLTALIAGIVFIISTYFMQIYFPKTPDTYFPDIDGTQPDILLLVGGSAFQAGVLGFAIVTVMASGISAHAGVSRLMYVMGRDGVINKKIFGHISPRFFTPTYNILIAGAVALTAGFTDLDTIVHLISFGALTAFSFVNLSVIARYVIRDKQYNTPKDILMYLIIPALGFISVVAMWISADLIAIQMGLGWAAIGLVYLIYLTRGFKQLPPQYKHDEKHMN